MNFGDKDDRIPWEEPRARPWEEWCRKCVQVRETVGETKLSCEREETPEALTVEYNTSYLSLHLMLMASFSLYSKSAGL